MKVCCYCRVSTQLQELKSQVEACVRYCQYREFEIGHIYQETISGYKADRPEYTAMLRSVRAGQYQGIVVFRLDRLGRNARELSMIIEELEKKNVKILSVTENFDTSTAFGRAMREMAFIFAQLERENISEATISRLAAIRASGKTLGRPVGAKDKDKRRKAGYLARYANKGGSQVKRDAVAMKASG